ncbi:hypothetical protein NPIL_7971 [Nephila pilipes]|uniref:Uncharacterized protein n=1 Tax=Nephila pilipes TaxID=299642 RepID=A0A8X6QZS3_NEPPI|nr:hypothetical protein NPIL_7971 [Nephila pilipes]
MFQLPPPPPVWTDQTLPLRGKKPAKRTRDSEGFISPPKHLTRKTPKANPNNIVQDVPTPDPDVDVNILDSVVAASPPKILPPFFR